MPDNIEERCVEVALTIGHGTCTEDRRLVVALCVIGGTRPNFRSRRSSCPTEANSYTGEVDPYATFIDRLVNPIYAARWMSPGTAPIRI
jgi:hypothetical protein